VVVVCQGQLFSSPNNFFLIASNIKMEKIITHSSFSNDTVATNEKWLQMSEAELLDLKVREEIEDICQFRSQHNHANNQVLTEEHSKLPSFDGTEPTSTRQANADSGISNEMISVVNARANYFS
jgi:hypothetical protein